MSASNLNGRSSSKRFYIQWVNPQSKLYGGTDYVDANDLAEARQTFKARYPYKEPVYIIERGMPAR